MLQRSDFAYDLPAELIASEPLAERTSSRMMLVDRQAGTISHHQVSEFAKFFTQEDLVVLNNTRVVPARFFSNDGGIELMRLDELSPTRWKCMVRPGKKMKLGRTVSLGESTGEVVEIDEEGNRVIAWDQVPDSSKGQLALPHYMERDPEAFDSERYQTTFAQEPGAIAAPTAGLHFTPELMAQFRHTFLTLHVGIGTFRPVKVDKLEEHPMHSESYRLSAETSDELRKNTGKTVAVGTTVTRVLEHLSATQGDFPQADSGDTDIFIYPPYQFRAVDALLTNFHLPESTLVMLVSAFASRELIMEAYHEAIREKYRFYSYGDCMLIV